MINDMLKEDGPKWSFAAMEYHAVILNRTFLVTVTATQICGARVHGLLASPPEFSPNWDALSLDPVERLLDRDDSVDIASEAYDRLDGMDFEIPLTELKRVRFDPSPKRGMGAMLHSGKLYLELQSGFTREFVLLGSQNGTMICERLAESIRRAQAS
jgi:hypothetical protein